MRTKNVIAALILVVVGVVFGAVLVSNFSWVRPSLAEVQIGSDESPVGKIGQDLSSFNEAFIEVGEKVTPSIVQITVVTTVDRDETPNDPFHFFFNFRDNSPQEVEGSGSGIIISDDGYILTNNHVVENASQVTVTLYDKTEYDAEVIGTDPLTDLAVIKIDAKGLPEAYLCDSDKIKGGQWVMAIGNPLSFTSTVTAGIVSAVNRQLRLIQDSYGVENYIQTDAVINRGNSGGALVDLSGAVIGINSAIATNGITASYIGYGFAIPINIAKSVSQDLIAYGKVKRGYIGVEITAINAATAKAIGLDKPRGVMIQNVIEDGAASKSDIKAGDVILKVDDKEVFQPNELQALVARHRAGEKVELALFRDGDEITRTVTLKAREGEENAELVSDHKNREKRSRNGVDEITLKNIGLTVKDMTDSELDDYNIENGILITNVKRFSKAYEQQLGKGLVITEADRKSIDSVDEFADIIDSKAGEAILLKVVDSKGTSRFVGVEVPKEE